MAQFRGLIITNRGQVSRLGHKTTGLRLTANGWNVGCEVHLEHVDGVDTITVYKTGGSNGRAEVDPIARYTKENGQGRHSFLKNEPPTWVCSDCLYEHDNETDAEQCCEARRKEAAETR
ncbi:hypothetical protein KAR91_27350 [Candidatus Pacearchaeota archaeon]|nr:hypothetical protein [Candidatus Pacearchaeota archaeon]